MFRSWSLCGEQRIGRQGQEQPRPRRQCVLEDGLGGDGESTVARVKGTYLASLLPRGLVRVQVGSCGSAP